ncbi:hypothetical protein BGX24_011701 [Mortierella sp. AD032]|nr:hypothetical protein BGX24_011701 [Mortierella sp. AD032]
MRMATVPRLQWLWGLLALFGSMAWFSMMPAYAFRGLWWWGEDDGWAQHQQDANALKKGGVNMMSEEEFDLKIGLGNRGKGRRNNSNTGSQGRLSYYADEEEEAMESRPAFVTPIASQFRASVSDEEGVQGDLSQAAAPSSYRQHHQRRQQQQQQQQQTRQQQQSQDHEGVTVLPRGGVVAGTGTGGGLVRKTSTTSMAPSISARLSTFFGQGWNSGPMPPPPAPEAPPPTPPIPVHHRPIRLETTSTSNKDGQDDTNGGGSGDKTSLHGDSYTTQWHNRRYDDWS